MGNSIMINPSASFMGKAGMLWNRLTPTRGLRRVVESLRIPIFHHNITINVSASGMGIKRGELAEENILKSGPVARQLNKAGVMAIELEKNSRANITQVFKILMEQDLVEATRQLHAIGAEINLTDVLREPVKMPISWTEYCMDRLNGRIAIEEKYPGQAINEYFSLDHFLSDPDFSRLTPTKYDADMIIQVLTKSCRPMIEKYLGALSPQRLDMLRQRNKLGFLLLLSCDFSSDFVSAVEIANYLSGHPFKIHIANMQSIEVSNDPARAESLGRDLVNDPDQYNQWWISREISSIGTHNENVDMGHDEIDYGKMAEMLNQLPLGKRLDVLTELQRLNADMAEKIRPLVNKG